MQSIEYDIDDIGSFATKQRLHITYYEDIGQLDRDMYSPGLCIDNERFQDELIPSLYFVKTYYEKVKKQARNAMRKRERIMEAWTKACKRLKTG